MGRNWLAQTVTDGRSGDPDRHERSPVTPTERRQLAESRARERHEARVYRLEGHKIGAWESLPEWMREELILNELARLTASSDRK